MISESGGGQAPPLPVSILFKLRRLRDRRMARPVGIDSGSNRVLWEAVTSSVVSVRTTAASVIRHENGKGGERRMAGEWEEPERLNRCRPDHEADTIAEGETMGRPTRKLTDHRHERIRRILEEGPDTSNHRPAQRFEGIDRKTPIECKGRRIVIPTSMLI